jgi:hypothetical protein
MHNQKLRELEARILEMTGRYPTASYVRISQQLQLVGISPSAVRYVWQRLRLMLDYQRLLWLERKSDHFSANTAFPATLPPILISTRYVPGPSETDPRL